VCSSIMGDAPQRNRLVLCFDGTSNRFQANSADTNIVKIYEMLDRESNNQYHYYQRKSSSLVRRS
jgi:uncharacterized protein (DUF2235 family)